MINPARPEELLQAQLPSFALPYWFGGGRWFRSGAVAEQLLICSFVLSRPSLPPHASIGIGAIPSSRSARHHIDIEPLARRPHRDGSTRIAIVLQSFVAAVLSDEGFVSPPIAFIGTLGGCRSLLQAISSAASSRTAAAMAASMLPSIIDFRGNGLMLLSHQPGSFGA